MTHDINLLAFMDAQKDLFRHDINYYIGRANNMVGLKKQIVVPQFQKHIGTMGVLTQESWEEIFYGAVPERDELRRCWRKVVAVQLPKRYGFFIPKSALFGLHTSNNEWYRTLYGKVLFHTRYEEYNNDMFQSDTQLEVSIHHSTYRNNVYSVTIFMTPESRLSNETWKYTANLLSRGDTILVTDHDFKQQLNRTEKMKIFNYCPPPTNYTYS